MMTRTLPRAATIWGAALILATAGSPRIAAAVNICDCSVSQITYPSDKNFPQPVPPGNPGDDTLTVQLDLGAGPITGGPQNQLTVRDVRFDLDCSDQFPVPGCTDQGDIMEYLGDASITTTCGGVTWSTTAITPNQLRFTPNPLIVIPAGTPIQCSLAFQVKVANFPGNNPPTTKEIASYGPNTTCDNMLTAAGFVTGQIFFCPVCDDNDVCTADSCNSDSGNCVFTPICGQTTTTTTSTTTTTTIPTTTTSTTLPPDSDGDGVPDSMEQCECEGTAPGMPVSAVGCSVDQACPCNAPLGRASWRNHGEYVRCVKFAAKEFVTRGVMTHDAAVATGRAAAEGTCGR